MFCEMVGKTKSHFEFFKKSQNLEAKYNGATAETLCIETTDEVEGTCDDFKDVKVDDQKQCHNLTSNDYNKTCCGLKVDYQFHGEYLSIIECYELSKYEEERKEEINKIAKKYSDVAIPKCDCKKEFIDYCYNYKVNNIDECLSKDAIHKHFSCCGRELTYQNGTTSIDCVGIGNTKSHRNLFNQIMKVYSEYEGFTYKTKCPDVIDDIKGTCQEFENVYVDNQDVCYKLPMNESDKSCCGLKLDITVPKKDKTQTTISLTECGPFSKDEKKKIK